MDTGDSGTNEKTLMVDTAAAILLLVWSSLIVCVKLRVSYYVGFLCRLCLMRYLKSWLPIICT